MRNQPTDLFDTYIERLKKRLDNCEDASQKHKALLLEKVIKGMEDSKQDYADGHLSYEEAYQEIRTLYYFVQTIIALRESETEPLDDLLGQNAAN